MTSRALRISPAGIRGIVGPGLTSATALEYGAAFVSHEVVLRQGSPQESDSLSDLGKPSLTKPLLVQGVAAKQVLLQGSRCPDTKLGSLG